MEGWALKIETFLGPDKTTSKTHVHKITIVDVPVFYMALGLNDFDGSKSITRDVGRGGP